MNHYSDIQCVYLMSCYIISITGYRKPNETRYIKIGGLAKILMEYSFKMRELVI